jgi:DNA-binding NarL/FixJ family response regulator
MGGQYHRNIHIIEQNKIFRESLKTALNQIPDFDIVSDSDNTDCFENLGDKQIQLILIDNNLTKSKCSDIKNKALALWPSVRFLLLINYKKEECNIDLNRSAKAILKNSSKKDFENRIREL